MTSDVIATCRKYRYRFATRGKLILFKYILLSSILVNNRVIVIVNRQKIFQLQLQLQLSTFENLQLQSQLLQNRVINYNFVNYNYNFSKPANHHEKIKNEKILRWRIELSTSDFDFVYRCWEENIAADALSYLKSLSMSTDKLRDVHESLCHPRETRMAHLVKVRNLPLSIDQIRQIIRSCLA